MWLAFGTVGFMLAAGVAVVAVIKKRDDEWTPRRIARAMRALPPQPIGALVAGTRACVVGEVRSLGPFTNRAGVPCVAHRFDVALAEAEYGTRTRSMAMGVVFELEDPSGVVRIDPAGAIELEPEQVSAGQRVAVVGTVEHHASGVCLIGRPGAPLLIARVD